MTIRNSDEVTDKVVFRDSATLFFGSDRDQALEYDAENDEITVTDANGNSTVLGGAGVEEVNFEPLSSAPSNPTLGLTVMADGSNWDPNAAGAAEIVTYDTDGTWSSRFTFAGTA